MERKKARPISQASLIYMMLEIPATPRFLPKLAMPKRDDLRRFSLEYEARDTASGEMTEFFREVRGVDEAEEEAEERRLSS